jgi:hypothetical protein
MALFGSNMLRIIGSVFNQVASTSYSMPGLLSISSIHTSSMMAGYIWEGFDRGERRLRVRIILYIKNEYFKQVHEQGLPYRFAFELV